MDDEPLYTRVVVTSHARARAGWFIVALAAAALVLAPSAVWPLPLAFVAIVVVLAIAPGAWLARRMLPEAPHDARVSLALLLSPFAVALAATLLRLAWSDPRTAARAVVTVIALLAAAEALRPRDRVSTTLGSRSAWLLALGSGVVILAAHALNPVLALRSDGAFHAGAVHALLRALPPEDPWFAGLSLRYFWGLHTWAACGVALVPGLSPALLLPVSGACAAIAALLAASALARDLGARPGASALAGLLVLLGASPFAWLALAARGGFGATTGFAPLLERGADTALRALDPGLLHPSLVLPLDKFVVVTPFAWGLVGAIVAPSLVWRWLLAPTVRHAVAMTLSLAAVVALHPVAGAGLMSAVLCGVAVSALARTVTWRDAAVTGALVMAAALVWLPPMRMFAPAAEGGASAMRLHASWRGIASVVFGGLALWPAVVAALASRTTDRPGTLPVTLFGGMLIALVLPAWVLQLGGDNQSKFLNLAFALAAPIAAVGAMHWAQTRARRTLLAAGMLAAWLPAIAALGWAYAHERTSSDDAPSTPPYELLAALAAESEPSAVIVDATLDATRGAAPGVPALTGRALLWSGAFMARKWGHPAAALAVRERVAAALAAGHWPEGADGVWLAALDREVWLIAPATLVPDAARSTMVVRARGVQLLRFTAP